MIKRKLLWVGDALVASGFAKCTHHILDVVKETWDVHVLGLNYLGDPHNCSYPVYPCWPGGDLFGVKRVAQLINNIKPDLLVIQNDPWNIPVYLERAGNVPVVATMPVDGKNCCGRKLNGLKFAIFWTEFGIKEAQLGGYSGQATAIPLGVDLDLYRPLEGVREKLKLPSGVENAYIVGNINRNQPRKRLDLTISYFAEWVKSHDVRDAYLFLHVAPTGDMGYDVSQLMQYYGLSSRLILAEPNIGQGIAESLLSFTYSAFDVQLSTTQGEGWGLTTMEGMACGVPQIMPDWSALGEWARDAAFLVPCTTTAATLNGINVIGGIADREKTIEALHKFYQSKDLRAEFSLKGLELVNRSEYRWENIGRQFAKVFDSIMW